MKDPLQENLLGDKHDRLLNALNSVIVIFVKTLAVLMVFVVLWALVDVCIHIYWQFLQSYNSFFSVNTLFTTIGSILVFLIAIEIYLNIVFYLQKDSINVELVLGTALTAIARKVIILDYTTVSNENMLAMAALILTVGLSLGLLRWKEGIPTTRK